jgi:hypothetical protein
MIDMPFGTGSIVASVILYPRIKSRQHKTADVVQQGEGKTIAGFLDCTVVWVKKNRFAFRPVLHRITHPDWKRRSGR